MATGDWLDLARRDSRPLYDTTYARPPRISLAAPVEIFRPGREISCSPRWNREAGQPGSAAHQRMNRASRGSLGVPVRKATNAEKINHTRIGNVISLFFPPPPHSHSPDRLKWLFHRFPNGEPPPLLSFPGVFRKISSSCSRQTPPSRQPSTFMLFLPKTHYHCQPGSAPVFCF